MRLFALATLAAAMVLSSGGSHSRLAAAQDKKDEKKEKELKQLLDAIEAAGKAKKYDEVVKLAKKASELDPKNFAIPYAAGYAHMHLRQPAEAAKAFTEAINLDTFKETLKAEPKLVKIYDSRGDAYLKSGKFKEAVADFDTYLKSNPKDAPDHWRRGLALYYAGRYKDGAAQFDAAQGPAREDVENSVWHYLCNARVKPKEEARKELIPVKDDARVPMKQVLELFAGKLKPNDVLDAAEKPKLTGDKLNSARFYAHLYVALYYESEGDAKKTLEHLTEAVEKYKVPDYMWDVAAAHLKVLKGKK